MTTLLLGFRHSEDNQALWRAATQRGWDVVRIQGLNIPEIQDDIVIYVEALFAPTIAKLLGRKLLDIPENWMENLPYNLVQRTINLMTLGEARILEDEVFVKPPNDKSFPARVYGVGYQLPAEFDDDYPVLVSDVVKWETEFRCFCLDGKVKTLSPYLRNGVLARETDFKMTLDEYNDAKAFAEFVLENEAPRAVVLDVGQINNEDRIWHKPHEWAVVEANAAWGSGIYGCNPEDVLEVIQFASEKI